MPEIAEAQALLAAIEAGAHVSDAQRERHGRECVKSRQFWSRMLSVTAGSRERTRIAHCRGSGAAQRSDRSRDKFHRVASADFGRGCIIGTEFGRNCATSHGTSIWGTSTGPSYTDEEYQTSLYGGKTVPIGTLSSLGPR